MSDSSGEFNCITNVMWHEQSTLLFRGITQCVTVAMCKFAFSEYHCYGNCDLQMKLLHRGAGIWAQEWALPCDLVTPALNSFLWSVNNFKMLLTILDRLQKILIKCLFWRCFKVLKIYKFSNTFFFPTEKV